MEDALSPPQPHARRGIRRRVKASLLWMDTATEGVRGRIALVLALIVTVVAPVADFALEHVAHVVELAPAVTAMNRLGGRAFDFFTFMSSIAALGVVAPMVLARLTALVTGEEGEEGGGGLRLRHLARLGVTEARLLFRRDELRVARLGAALFLMAQSLIATLAIGRWVAWWVLARGLGLRREVAPWSVRIDEVSGWIALVSLVGLLVVVVGLLVWVRRKAQQLGGGESLLIDPRMLKVDERPVWALREPGGVARLGRLFKGEEVRRLLESLHAWRPSRCATEADVQASLHRHLRRRGHRVALEVHMREAQRRIDVVVDERTAIELKLKLDKVGSRDRATHQVQDYARHWPGKGPVLLLVMDMSEAHAPAMAEVFATWNRGLKPTRPEEPLPAPIFLLTASSR